MEKTETKSFNSKLFVFLLFFLSGFSGLIYQVLWMRQFKLVLGSSIFSVSIVVASFMIGLFLGSWLVGKAINGNKIKNELRFYGYMELFIGLYAFLFLFLVKSSGPVYGAVYLINNDYFYLKLILNAIITLFFLVIPTSAMGATLPLLINYYSKRLIDFRSTVSVFYAINTLGGAFAALISGFYLIKYFGVTSSISIAAVINIIIGLSAYLISFKPQDITSFQINEPEKTSVKSEKKYLRSKQILFLSLLTGFIAISYEVLWVRCLNYLLNNSTYTFSLILFIFLASMAVGSFLNTFLASVKNKYSTLAVLQFILSISALFTIYVFYSFVYSDFFKNTFAGNDSANIGWHDNIGLNLYLTLIVFLIPSLIMGISFPLISELYFEHSKDKPGAAISSVYVYNMSGSILGSLIPVFVFIPLLGSVKQTLLAIIFLNLAISIFLAYKSASRFKTIFIIGMPLIFVLAFFTFNKGEMLNSLEGADEEQINDKVTFYKEGTMATVKIYEKLGQYKSLSIDGVTIASESFYAKEKSIAQLPFFTNREFKSVLAIGLASGTTIGSMLYQNQIDKITAVEIVPTVIEAAEFFKNSNNDLLHNSKVEIVCDDITSFLAHTNTTFDLISSDGKFGALNKANTTMLSEDFYRLCLKRLSPAGIFIQWISTEIPNKHFKTILATTQTVFPNSELFLFKKNLYILSSAEPFSIDVQKISSALNDKILSREINDCAFYSPEEVLSGYCGSIKKAEENITLNNFDNPVIEYDYQQEKENDEKQTGASSLANLLYIYSNFLKNEPATFNKVISKGHTRNYSTNKSFLQSRIAYINGHLANDSKDFNKAAGYFNEVVLLNHPDNWNDVAISAKILAEMSLKNKEYNKAILFCSKAIELIPEFSDVYTLRGIAKYNIDSLAASKADFEKALSINPNDETAKQFLK